MNYLVAVLGTFIAALAGFFLKKSSGCTSMAGILRSRAFYIGGFLYVMSSIITIFLLQKMPYSAVVPLGGTCYVWTLLISRVFLGEKINRYKTMGLGFIIIGILFLSK